MTSLSSCCQAPVGKECESDSGVLWCPKCDNPCTVNASAVEDWEKELLKILDEKAYPVRAVTEFIKSLLVHASTSDSTLREVMGLKKRLGTDYHGYSPEADIYNTAIDDAFSIITKRLEK